ncbi:nickel-binding protein [Echinicola shivajiensis]|uniref:nickel-binding protein n=1 Tax=Echinicola shivajiensis TaxID=1035916 RepID=UPI001BFC9969|nr:nickel-binding protein [Echinicola shivajiensis]
MPLFMDFHQFDHITLEDVKMSLIRNEAMLENYGVKYHQFWVNEDTGTVFCLIEGPDKATCEKVYPLLTYKQIVFSLNEVEPGFFKNMKGVNPFIIRDQIEEQHRIPDLGNRYILSLSLWLNSPHSNYSTPIPSWAIEVIKEIMEENESKASYDYKTEDFLAQFKEGNQAFSSALKIQSQLIEFNKHALQPVSFKIGLCDSKTETSNYLKPAIQYAQCLSRIANNEQILVSSPMAKQIQYGAQGDSSSIKIISPAEESFILKVCKTSDLNLSDQNFTISKLCKYIGISRPQLYRKITAITGRSPIIFLRDLRLEKARGLLMKKTENIAQVAMEVGYSSPSYFTKCFSEKFGYKPSYLLAH